MHDLIFNVILAVFTLITGAIARYVMAYVKMYIEKSKYAELLQYVGNVVWAMQQKLVDNEEKKETAIMLIHNWLEEKNIDISECEIDVLIEAAVKELKAALREDK